MSTLNKGDLVMTEHGLGWFRKFFADGGWGVELLDGTRKLILSEPPKATRAEVEAYLKEKVWEKIVNGTWVSRVNQYFIQPTVDSGYRVKLDGSHYEKSFDTAPAMQAEAITMAKLLNATKP